MSTILRALRHRNYRLFFGGQIISLTGTWMTNVATSWLVYRLTGSAWALGFVGFAGQAPAFLTSPFAGILVDRTDKRRLLMATQTLSMAQSLTLAWLTLSGRITLPLLTALSALQGLINSIDIPTRQSFLVEMIEAKEDLSNAIALNSSMANGARLVGPGVGGLVIAAIGEGWCFFIDGVSYLAVLWALWEMTPPPRPAPRRLDKHPLHQLKEGWNYTVGSAPIRSILLLLALASLLGVPYTVLVPVYAGRILHGGPHTLGLLMTSIGCGALSAALWLASRRTVLGLGRAIPIAAAAFGAGLIAFSFSRILWLSCALLVVTGFGFMVQLAASNTIVQTIVDDDKRGRVMSFFVMAFLGTAPFGSLLAGSLAERIGAPHSLALGGLCCIAGAGWFALRLPAIRRDIRPIYVRLGILTELAAEMQGPSALPKEIK